MADKMTGKKPKKARVETTVAEGGQKSGELLAPKKEAEQRKKRK